MISIEGSAPPADATPLTGGVLHLHAVEGAVRPGLDLVLWPGCYPGDAVFDPAWPPVPFIDPLRDNDRSQLEALRTMHFAEEQLAEWTERLNAQHGTSYSEAFWRVVVTPWLLELAQRIWRSFVTLEAVIAEHGERPMRVEIWTRPVQWEFSTIKQFFDHQLLDDSFNWWVDSLVLKAIAPAHWTLTETTAPPVRKAVKPSFQPSPNLKRRIIRWVKYRLGFSDVLGAGAWGLLIAALVNFGRPRSPAMGLKPVLQPAEPLPEIFRRVFEAVAPQVMPRAYGADFPEFCRIAQRIPYRPGRLRIGTIDAWNEQEKVISAHAAEAGEVLVQIQHGGGYGMHRGRRRTCITEYAYGPFITWGWTRHCDYSGRFVPLPSPKLSRLADRYGANGGHGANDGTAILIGERIRWRECRLVQQPSASGWKQYLDDVVELLQALPEPIGGKVRIRPYREILDCDTDLAEYIKSRYRPFPRVDGPLDPALQRCKLAIMTPGTTLHFTMAANIPTLMFWTEGQFPMSPEARPFMDAFRDCGVYCATAEEAAAQLTRVWDDVDGWWLSDPVQRARKAWVDHYARTDRAWFRQWVTTLRRL